MKKPQEKTYTFNLGFSIKEKIIPFSVYESHGETHVAECMVFDVIVDRQVLGTFDTFAEAKRFGIEHKST